MSIIIKSAYINIKNNNQGIIDHVTEAVEECIHKSNINKHQINLIIYMGIAKENLSFEPSMAALI